MLYEGAGGNGLWRRGWDAEQGLSRCRLKTLAAARLGVTTAWLQQLTQKGLRIAAPLLSLGGDCFSTGSSFNSLSHPHSSGNHSGSPFKFLATSSTPGHTTGSSLVSCRSICHRCLIYLLFPSIVHKEPKLLDRLQLFSLLFNHYPLYRRKINHVLIIMIFLCILIQQLLQFERQRLLMD